MNRMVGLNEQEIMMIDGGGIYMYIFRLIRDSVVMETAKHVWHKIKKYADRPHKETSMIGYGGATASTFLNFKIN